MESCNHFAVVQPVAFSLPDFVYGRVLEQAYLILPSRFPDTLDIKRYSLQVKRSGGMGDNNPAGKFKE